MAITDTAGNSTKARLAQRPVTDLSQLSFKKNKDSAAGPSQPQVALPPLPRRSASTSQSPGIASPTAGSPLLETA